LCETRLRTFKGLQARDDFQIGTDRNGLEPDDPDANFYENFGCQLARNYSGYCNEEVARLIDHEATLAYHLEPQGSGSLVDQSPLAGQSSPA